MGGHGSFSDKRLDIHIVQKPGEVKPELPHLRKYQFELPEPTPAKGSFDPAAAARGKTIFATTGKCATCHVPPLYTDAQFGVLHAPSETGMDPAYAERSATKKYRTTPLRGLARHAPYFHDGSAATLTNVVSHYDAVLHLGLGAREKQDLVEFLKSL
jgi:hypothetical protein